MHSDERIGVFVCSFCLLTKPLTFARPKSQILTTLSEASKMFLAAKSP